LHRTKWQGHSIWDHGYLIAVCGAVLDPDASAKRLAALPVAAAVGEESFHAVDPGS
jgi:hypothetical protein